MTDTTRRRTAGAIALAAVLLAAGCSSDGTDGAEGAESSAATTQEGGAMGVSTEDVAARAAEVLDVPRDRVVVDPSSELAPACRIHTAWDEESLDPYPLALAELPDGTLVDDRAEGAAEAVLRACWLDPGETPDPASAAEAIVRFGDLPGPLAVAAPEPARRRLGELGLDYEDPTLTDGDDGTTLRFFAENLELGDLLLVTARWTPDGALTLDNERF